MLATNILMNALCFEIFLWSISSAEWIDLPQFSDEKKIYRIPPSKQDHFYKFSQTRGEDQFSYEYQNVAYEDLAAEQTAINESIGHVSYELEDSISESAFHEQANKENVFVTSTEQYDETTVFPTVATKDTNEEYPNETSTSNDIDILKYLPVDILKNVHRTLKSQPTSSEGKILFLKTFEKTLMTEIEFRLAQTVKAGREKRGADHYDHGYDSHEHATGFPSIEGALMAISFLTFAVYLVRLVMLLFRNMNNSAMTTVGPTLFLGRRKRSINTFDEDTAKILSNVDTLFSNF